MFDKVTWRMAGGRTLVIGKQGSGIYVQKVTLDGVEYAKSWLPIAKLHVGMNRLDFTVGPVPNMVHGTKVGDRPPAFR
jgi:putative alpha-1,2-mannosidase